MRNALREPGTAVSPALEAGVAELHRHLDAAAGVLDASGGRWARFAQSAGIILREGFEVVLIVGALLAYVRRSGQTALVRPIWIGAGLGVVASVGTAFALATVFTLNPGASDALEGAAMLLAAGVLFWVSYWLISKAEAERWQRYIQGKVQHAVAAGSATALAAAAFLAVYREGFETVLFYRALLGAAPAGDVMVGGGFLAGLARAGRGLGRPVAPRPPRADAAVLPAHRRLPLPDGDRLRRPRRLRAAGCGHHRADAGRRCAAHSGARPLPDRPRRSPRRACWSAALLLAAVVSVAPRSHRGSRSIAQLASGGRHA